MFVKIRRYFLSGLVVFLPLTLTVFLFVWALSFADGLLGKYLEPYFAQRFGFYFKGLGIILLVAIIILIGFFVTNYFGKKIHGFFERLLLKLPFFKQVYPAIKEMALFLFSRPKVSFQQVVLVEYPRKGVYSFGFLTNDTSQRISNMTRQELCNVFIPSSPGPLTGFVILVPKKEIIFTELSVEQILKFIVSGGVVNPI